MKIIKMIKSLSLLLLLGFILSLGGCKTKSSEFDFALISKKPDRIIYTQNGSRKVFINDSPEYGKLNRVLLQAIEQGISTSQTSVRLDELESAGEQAIHYEFPADTTVKLEHPPVKKLTIKTVVIPLKNMRNNIIFNPGSYLYGPIDAEKFEQEIN